MSDVSTPELDWHDAPEVPLDELEVDDEVARFFRHLLPRSAVLLRLNDGVAMVAAVECPEEAVIERIVDATGIPEVDLVRVSEETLHALNERLKLG